MQIHLHKFESKIILIFVVLGGKRCYCFNPFNFNMKINQKRFGKQVKLLKLGKKSWEKVRYI